MNFFQDESNLLSQLIEWPGAGDISNDVVCIEVNSLHDGILILLLMISTELCTKEHVYSCPVVGSMERDYGGVVAIDKGE
uniref:Uncharacterized protein n=1 Tax=Romanomermis culicivorax TaxID=13658 RepID=A0A915JMM3_ROMCU